MNGALLVAYSLENLLQAATQVVTWMITSMTSYLGFITANPVV